MTTEQRELMKIALHESGHAVVGLALGFDVSRVRLETFADTVVGTTYLRFKPDALISHRVATLLGGTAAARLYQGVFRLSVPPAVVYQRAAPQHASHRQASRLAGDIHRFQYMKTAAETGSSWDGDGGVITALLARCRKPEAVFARAERLCHGALSANDRQIYAFAKALLCTGDLRGAALQELTRRVVRISPDSMDIR